jgi:hypothetical protein
MLWALAPSVQAAVEALQLQLRGLQQQLQQLLQPALVEARLAVAAAQPLLQPCWR